MRQCGKQPGILDNFVRACERDPFKRVYTFLADGETESEGTSYEELVGCVAGIARGIRESGLRGKTVLLLIRHPIRFLECFLGCLWSGAIPVPAAIPRRNQTSSFLLAISQSARIAAAISDIDAPEALRKGLGLDASGTWLGAAELAGPGASPAGLSPIEAGEIAFLQYTSGSTGNPKGVVVTHRNLLANEVALQTASKTNCQSQYVAWLPLYHDMGLIGHALPSIFLGASCVLMPPAAFVQKPIRWLKAISRYRATHGGGPNFAFDLLAQKYDPLSCDDLDLSSWECAYNGGEPIRAATIDEFYSRYAVHGFRRTAMYPCYGLAESTLIVSGNPCGTGPRSMRLNRHRLGSGIAALEGSDGSLPVEVVSCGSAIADAEIAIVNPVTREKMCEGQVGEVWVRGSSVCQGYFELAAESREQFAVSPAGADAERYLRTGDLGFLQNAELYITGRRKDVIIIRGQNYYPQDLEATASRSDPLLAAGLAAAVMLNASSQHEDLCVICELTRRGWLSGHAERLSRVIREAIANEYGLSVRKVLLIRPGTLPRTSSGKVRRSTCRERATASAFETLVEGVTRKAGTDGADTGMTYISREA